VDTSDKKFNSRLVVPTVFLDKPFGQNVEGLSYFRDESCAVEPAVQTEDFEDSTAMNRFFRLTVSRNC
jgi:hypothetical protein